MENQRTHSSGSVTEYVSTVPALVGSADISVDCNKVTTAIYALLGPPSASVMGTLRQLEVLSLDNEHSPFNFQQNRFSRHSPKAFGQGRFSRASCVGGQRRRAVGARPSNDLTVACRSDPVPRADNW